MQGGALLPAPLSLLLGRPCSVFSWRNTLPPLGAGTVLPLFLGVPWGSAGEGDLCCEI